VSIVTLTNSHCEIRSFHPYNFFENNDCDNERMQGKMHVDDHDDDNDDIDKDDDDGDDHDYDEKVEESRTIVML
jgi:hypothetical protein